MEETKMKEMKVIGADIGDGLTTDVICATDVIEFLESAIPTNWLDSLYSEILPKTHGFTGRDIEGLMNKLNLRFKEKAEQIKTG